MEVQPIEKRIEELCAKNFSREEMLKTLYMEMYPLYEITEILNITSEELKTLSLKLNLPYLRCPSGHRFVNDPALHTEDAHYCIVCRRWFNDSTLRDEINLEIQRLEANAQFSKRNRLVAQSVQL